MLRVGFSLALAAALLAGVACTPTPPPLSPRAGQVTLSEAAAPANFVELGPVTAQSGKGCGVLGSPGSRPDAEAKLRAAADKLGASYVHLTQREAPRTNHQCMEHEHKLSGVAYRAPATPTTVNTPAPAPSASASASPAPPTSRQLPLVLRNYEGDTAIGKPAPVSDSSSVLLALAAGDPSGSALSVTCTCRGPEPRGNLDVWASLSGHDLRGASSLTFRIKPDSALALSVSFLDGNHARYTQQSEPLTPGAWQKVLLPLYKFWRDPLGPAGDNPSAPLDLSRVDALGFAPRACAAAHFFIDDFQLE